MRERIFVIGLTLALVLGISVPAESQTVGSGKADPARMQKAIDNLGSGSFAAREQASRELEEFGPAAMELLKKAVKYPDAEVSCRASRLVARLDERMRMAQLLAAKKFRLNLTDVTVIDAVAKLAELSGNKIEITGNRAALASRKITLQTGEVTMWEALQELCQKGGLVEQVQFSGSPIPNNMPIQRFPPPQPLLPQQMQVRTIVLADGTPQNLPTSFLGSIRVRALPVGLAGRVQAGEKQVLLDVTAEQRLQNFGIVGALVFDKAADDQQQLLALLPEPVPGINAPVNNFNAGRIMIVNGNVIPIGGPAALLQRNMVFRFQQGAKAARTMKELSGKLIVQALSDPEELVTVKDIRRAAGKIVKGKDGNVIHVESVDVQNGALKIQVTLESISEHGNVGQNAFGGPNVMVVNGNFNGNFNGVQFFNGVPVNDVPTNFPKLLDAKGKSYAAEVVNQRPEVSNGQIQRHATLIYRTQGEGASLVLFGQRNIHFAVPFSLKDIPLQ